MSLDAKNNTRDNNKNLDLYGKNNIDSNTDLYTFLISNIDSGMHVKIEDKEYNLPVNPSSCDDNKMVTLEECEKDITNLYRKYKEQINPENKKLKNEVKIKL